MLKEVYGYKEWAVRKTQGCNSAYILLVLYLS